MRYGDQAIVRGYVHERDRKVVESVQITCLNWSYLLLLKLEILMVSTKGKEKHREA